MKKTTVRQNKESVLRSGRKFFPALALLVAGQLLSMAQPGLRLDSPSTRSVVTIVRIKPEMLNQWLDLQKSGVVPALKKRGLKTRTVYASVAFGTAFEYTIVQPLTTFCRPRFRRRPS